MIDPTRRRPGFPAKPSALAAVLAAVFLTLSGSWAYAGGSTPGPAPVPTAPTTTPSFRDVPPTFWAYGAISELARRGIVDGYPDGTFRPQNDMTRAEFATLLDRLFKWKRAPSAVTPFKDVPPDAWYAQAIADGVAAGVIRPKDYGPVALGVWLNPTGALRRDELAEWTVLALRNLNVAPPSHLPTFPDLAPQMPRTPFIDEAAGWGIVNGYPGGFFSASNHATRAEVATVVVRAMKVAGMLPADATFSYQVDPRLASLAATMPFTLLVPAYVPGLWPLQAANWITPPPGPGMQPPPGEDSCEMVFGEPGSHAVLQIYETNWLHPRPHGIPGQKDVVVDAARHLEGISYISSYDNLHKTPDYTLWMQVGDVQVTLTAMSPTSSGLKPADLVAVARSLVPLPLPGGSGHP